MHVVSCMMARDFMYTVKLIVQYPVFKAWINQHARNFCSLMIFKLNMQ